MKRSEVNQIIQSAEVFIRKRGFYLPPFAYWSPQEWRDKGGAVSGIINAGLGWDITDFGSGDFANTGLFLFTLRNGNLAQPGSKPYAEKIMVVEEGQVTPLHFHWEKVEDIINRGGGQLVFQLYNATEDEDLADTAVTVIKDSIPCTVPAGGLIKLKPGESLTLQPYCYHAFWGEGDRVLVGEVSSINDDKTDNNFYGGIGRFATIEEDEPPIHLLVTDYHQAWLNLEDQ